MKLSLRFVKVRKVKRSVAQTQASDGTVEAIFVGAAWSAFCSAASAISWSSKRWLMAHLRTNPREGRGKGRIQIGTVADIIS
jgi:hypothetical protein